MATRTLPRALLALALAAPGFASAAPDPAVAKQCETVWPKAKTADKQQTWTCLTHFLTHAYGGPPTEESMTLDPGYGHPLEVELSTEDLDRMIAHVKAVCDPEAAPVESECHRGHEYFTGMRGRRLGLFEDVAVGSIEAPLRKVLAGEALTEADVFADNPDVALSPLSLWKLRNAAYARHGYAFKTPDLNAFFYGPRAAGETTLLPLKVKPEKKKAELSPTDAENVRLIKRLEAEAKKKR